MILILRHDDVRAAINMADAMSRMSSGRTVGVFTMQSGPGTENSFGGVAQAYAELVRLAATGHGMLLVVDDLQQDPRFARDAAESTMVAKQTVGLDSTRARQALRLVELLEELEDVQRVTANFDIPEDVFAEVAG